LGRLQAIDPIVALDVQLAAKPTRGELDELSTAAISSSLTAQAYGYSDAMNPLTCLTLRDTQWTKRCGPEDIDADIDARISAEIMRSHLPMLTRLTRPSVSNPKSVSHVGAFLGGGAFGKVFQAHLRTGRTVALKRISLAPGESRDTREREMLEYIASHGTHNNIVRYLGGYGADTSWGTTEECLVMELMSSDLGSCIKERTAMQKGLSFAEAMVVMHGVASGLAHLHSIGVTHRDLKPQNILIDRRCRAPSVGSLARIPRYRWRADESVMLCDADWAKSRSQTSARHAAFLALRRLALQVRTW